MRLSGTNDAMPPTNCADIGAGPTRETIRPSTNLMIVTFSMVRLAGQLILSMCPSPPDGFVSSVSVMAFPGES